MVVMVVMVRDGALPAPARLDLDALASITGRRPLRLATESEFAHLFPECEPGAMPPFGHLHGVDLYVAAVRPTVAALSAVSRAA